MENECYIKFYELLEQVRRAWDLIEADQPKKAQKVLWDAHLHALGMDRELTEKEIEQGRRMAKELGLLK
jgi:hypothetical protein